VGESSGEQVRRRLRARIVAPGDHDSGGTSDLNDGHQTFTWRE
jgi:hypothetical protein